MSDGGSWGVHPHCPRVCAALVLMLCWPGRYQPVTSNQATVQSSSSSTALVLTSECSAAPCGRQRYCSVHITIATNSKPETKPRVFADAFWALNKCGCMGSGWGWVVVFPRTHMKSTSLCCPLSRHLHSSHSCPQLASPPSAHPSLPVAPQTSITVLPRDRKE